MSQAHIWHNMNACNSWYKIDTYCTSVSQTSFSRDGLSAFVFGIRRDLRRGCSSYNTRWPNNESITYGSDYLLIVTTYYTLYYVIDSFWLQIWFSSKWWSRTKIRFPSGGAKRRSFKVWDGMGYSIEYLKWRPSTIGVVFLSCGFSPLFVSCHSPLPDSLTDHQHLISTAINATNFLKIELILKK